MNHLLMALIAMLPADATQYKEPPAPIPAILDAAPSPTVRVSPDRKWLLVMERPALPPISEVGAPELRLAGLRINPRTYAGSRDAFMTGLKLIAIPSGGPSPAKGRPAKKPLATVSALPTPITVQIPEGRRIAQALFSPDSKSLAVILSTEEGLELAIADVATGATRKVTDAKLSGVLTSPCAWSANMALVCLMRTEGKPPVKSVTPTGPAIQETRGGSAPNPTYQDMLQDQGDEAIFEHYATSKPVRITLDGAAVPIGPWNLYRHVLPSPDGHYVVVQKIARPFSYVVPFTRFPTTTEVWNADGTLARRLAETPLQDGIAISNDAVPVGPRDLSWRGDAPATLTWAEARDNGDPANAAAKRDAVMMLGDPFSGAPQTFVELDYRCGAVDFGRDGSAVVTESWHKTRRTRTWRLRAGTAPEVLFDRSSEDRYGDPGDFLTSQGANGPVLQTSADGKALYLTGLGASPEGDRPFVDRFDLLTRKTTRLFRSTAPRYEQPLALLDGERTLLLRRESVSEPPNYLTLSLTSKAETRLTDFLDPTPQLGELKPEVLHYKRKDGVDLTANLYLPKGYTKEQGPLPFLLWAYPQEFASASAASQVSGSPYRFQRPQGASQLFLLTLGYGILDDPKMPIVGENGKEPNDTYIPQLIASAEAAVKAIVDLGVADPKRIAVGGHSYGAFMTANLLAHTDLFAAGIARSGAYNRTLTPFGFQNEDRTFWQAEDTYMAMSPFAFADKIKTPILLIHGAADTNTGTYPIQSDRFFAALKGHGATARLVFLPAEAHGYRARESVGHTLYEMANWLDTYVKNRK
ncbi:MAG: prolyl oligopeptidase family serine peptidase [Vicinamibacteria bacterium]